MERSANFPVYNLLKYILMPIRKMSKIISTYGVLKNLWQIDNCKLHDEILLHCKFVLQI